MTGHTGDNMDLREIEMKGLEAVRRGMDVPSRLVKAAECKQEANVSFAAKQWQQALVGYTAGIWFLKRGEQRCPRVLASATDAAAYAEAPSALGAGEPTTDEKALPAELDEQRESLRISLHLNLAAAALKLSKWEIARTACQFVLMVQGDEASSKARYRLARALEGEEQFDDAISILEKLIALDAANADAQKLLAELRARMAAAPKAVDYSMMGAEEWAKLSQEEQQRALEDINRQLDAEMGEDPAWDDERLKALASSLPGGK